MRHAPLVVAVLAGIAGCLAPDATPTAATPAPFDSPAALTLTSPAFSDAAPIPRKHTCDGENVSPPLVVTGVPPASPVLALLVIDSDVPLPQAPLREVTHWLAWNVPVAAGGATFAEAQVPNGTVQGAGAGGAARYGGPCPPHGSPPHRYVFTLHALDAPLDLEQGASRQELEAAIDGHVLDTAVLVGTYARALT